jgi:hypothetical protein
VKNRALRGLSVPHWKQGTAERHLCAGRLTMSQTDKLAAPPVLRSGSEPAVVEETPVRASADSAEAFEEERAVMPRDESSDAKAALAEVARLRRELHAKDAADAASAAILAEKTLRIRELEQEVKHLDDELRSAPATPPPPPPPPPVKQTPKKKRFSLRNFFGCRGGSPG